MEFKCAILCRMSAGFLLVTAARPLTAQRSSALPRTNGPIQLRVDDLTTPLGIDDPAPRLSWQLQDPARGARQSAYCNSSTPELLSQDKPDIWDSGRVQSAASLNIHYAGPAIKPSTRYFWAVKLWDTAANPYSEAPASWWETGLLTQDAWRADWIGYETPEEAAVRHAPAAWIASADAKALAAEKGTEQRIAYRQTITLDKPIRSAALYATGQDTVSAWVNGTQLLIAAPLPPYKQMPWKKFVRADATAALAPGSNTIAIELLHYVTNPAEAVNADAPPMIATLVVEYTDGTTAAFATNPTWKSAMHAAPGWTGKSFDDSAWKPAVVWSQQPPTRHAKPIGHPWIPDSVKALNHPFEVKSAIKSARIYATALGKLTNCSSTASGSATTFLIARMDRLPRTRQISDLRRHQPAKPRTEFHSRTACPRLVRDPLEWFQQPNNYGDTPPALRAQLRIEYADGKVDWVATNPAWQARPSYILHSEIYDGETQNYALMQPSGYSSKLVQSWWKAIAIDPAPIRIEAQDFQPIRVERTLTAKSVTEPKPGVYVYDFGQNFSGVEQLHIDFFSGSHVRVRFAEILNDDGTIYTDNLRTARATDHFILSAHRLRGTHPTVHFPRLPLPRNHRPSHRSCQRRSHR